MASIWTALKEPVYNFGQSYPILSTVSFAVICGFLWWALVVKGPKASAQSQTPAVQQSAGAGSVQQSASASGNATINQAGRDQTINQTIINQGVSEETIRKLINQKAVSTEPELTARYPKGYVLLGVADGKIVYYSNHAPKNLKVDWQSSEIRISPDRKDVDVRVPDIYVIDSQSTIQDFTSGFHYENGAIERLARIGDHALYAEVLDIDNGILVVGMK
jgi:hypothetical protein